eukprot:Gb_18309 [translate_table: standard]
MAKKRIATRKESTVGAALQAWPSPHLFHFPSTSSSSTVDLPKTTDPDILLSAFGNRLSSQLEDLQSTSDNQSPYLTAEWLRQALDVSLSTHYHVEKLFPHIREAHLHENCNWVNQHLDDTVKLLDVCNVLRRRISSIKRYEESVQLAIHCLEGKAYLSEIQFLRSRNAFANCIQTLEKLEGQNSEGQQRSELDNCRSILKRIMGQNPVIDSTPHAGKSIKEEIAEEIINESKATTAFVCGALVAAFSFKSKLRSFPVTHNVQGQFGWCSSLVSLQHKLKQAMDMNRKTKSAHSLLRELDRTDAAVRCLLDLLNRIINCKLVPLNDNNNAAELKQSVQNLKRWAVELEQGMAPFEKQINDLFNVVVTSRMALLHILTYSSASH